MPGKWHISPLFIYVPLEMEGVQLMGAIGLPRLTAADLMLEVFSFTN
jgi:hypothetical protein